MLSIPSIAIDNYLCYDFHPWLLEEPTAAATQDEEEEA